MMNVNHSSLLADTSMSETTLARLGVNFVEREDDRYCKPKTNQFKFHPYLMRMHFATWPPFANKWWPDDEDVKTYFAWLDGK